VSWNPNKENLLGSCGVDRRALLWDLNRIGQSQTEEERAEGPPELLFVHGGHTASVLDFSWNSDVDHSLVAATVAEDNILQIWKIGDWNLGS